MKKIALIAASLALLASPAFAADDAKKNSEHATRFGDKNRLGQELPQDVATAGAHRFAHANFLYPVFRHIAGQPEQPKAGNDDGQYRK